MPITWRNVNTPNFGASNNLLVQGGKSITGAFDSVVNYGLNDRKQRLDADKLARDTITKDLTDQALQGRIEQQNNINNAFNANNEANLNAILAKTQGQTINNNQAPQDFALRQQLGLSNLANDNVNRYGKQLDNYFKPQNIQNTFANDATQREVTRLNYGLNKQKLGFDMSNKLTDNSFKNLKFNEGVRQFDKSYGLDAYRALNPNQGNKAKPSEADIRRQASRAFIKDNPTAKQSDINKALIRAGITPVKLSKSDFKAKSYTSADKELKKASNIDNDYFAELNVLVNEAKANKVDPKVLSLAISKAHTPSYLGDDNFHKDRFMNIINSNITSDKLTAEEIEANTYNNK